MDKLKQKAENESSSTMGDAAMQKPADAEVKEKDGWIKTVNTIIDTMLKIEKNGDEFYDGVDQYLKKIEDEREMDIAEWLSRFVIGETLDRGNSGLSGHEKTITVKNTRNAGEGEDVNKGALYEYPLYIAGTRGYDSGWVYFNKNDALLIAQNFDNLLTQYKNTDELNQFMSELTGIPDVVQTRKTIMDLHNKLFGMNIELSKEKLINEATIKAVQESTPSYSMPTEASLRRNKARESAARDRPSIDPTTQEREQGWKKGGGYINTQRKVKGSKGNRTLKRIKKKQKKKNKNKNKKKKS